MLRGFRKVFGSVRPNLAQMYLSASAPPSYEIYRAAANGWESALIRALETATAADVQKSSSTGITALHAAARGGHVRCAQRLLQAGASVDAEGVTGGDRAHRREKSKRGPGLAVFPTSLLPPISCPRPASSKKCSSHGASSGLPAISMIHTEFHFSVTLRMATLDDVQRIRFAGAYLPSASLVLAGSLIAGGGGDDDDAPPGLRRIVALCLHRFCLLPALGAGALFGLASVGLFPAPGASPLVWFFLLTQRVPVSRNRAHTPPHAIDAQVRHAPGPEHGRHVPAPRRPQSREAPGAHTARRLRGGRRAARVFVQRVPDRVRAERISLTLE